MYSLSLRSIKLACGAATVTHSSVRYVTCDMPSVLYVALVIAVGCTVCCLLIVLQCIVGDLLPELQVSCRNV